jgi:hypothetical protein
MIHGFLEFQFFGSFTWFLISAIVLLACFFIAELSEQGFVGTVAVAVFLALNYYWGNVPTMKVFTWPNVGIYLLLGFIYAVIRTYFFGREQSSISNYVIDELKGNVFRWWLLFPISLVVWTLSDLLENVWNLVYDICSNGFEYVLNIGYNSKKK